MKRFTLGPWVALKGTRYASLEDAEAKRNGVHTWTVRAKEPAQFGGVDIAVGIQGAKVNAAGLFSAVPLAPSVPLAGVRIIGGES